MNCRGKKSLEDQENGNPEKISDDILEFLHEKYFEFI